MTRILTEGFELMDGQMLLWGELTGSSIWTNASNKGDDGYPGQNPFPYTGSGCVKLGTNQDLTVDLANIFGGAVDEVYIGFWFYARVGHDTNRVIGFSVDEANYDGLVRFRIDGSVQLVRTSTVLATSAAGAITFNQWNHCQVWFHPDPVAGDFQVKINDGATVSFSGDTTDDLSQVYQIQIGAGNAADTNANMFVDDLVVNSSAGGSQNSWPGMVRLYPMRVKANGSNTDLTIAGDNMGSNAAQVAQAGRRSTVQSSTVDQYDLYTVHVPDIPVTGTIEAVHVVGIASVDAGAGNIALGLKPAGGEDWGSDQALGNTFNHFQESWFTNPDDAAAWDEADLAGIEIGVKVR